MTTQQHEQTSNQTNIVREFFARDSCAEMIESINTLLEDCIFSSDIMYVTPEIRAHIVNQLRVVTFLSKLDDNLRWKTGPALKE